MSYNSHVLKLYATNDLHYLNLRDAVDLVPGFAPGQPVHEIRYTDAAGSTEHQPIFVRGLHVEVEGQTTGVGWKLGDLSSQVTAEVTAREAAVSQLNSELTHEINRAEENEGRIETDLATERVRAMDSELVLTNAVAALNGSTAVADEQARALSAEAALSARITQLEGVIAALLQ